MDISGSHPVPAYLCELVERHIALQLRAHIRVGREPYLSGLCLCKGEAQIGPGRPFAHTKHTGDYCRGLTAHSTLSIWSY